MSLHSILIPAFNAAPFIQRTIESCLSQSYGDIEILVSDNNSVDSTFEIVKRFNDPRIRLYKQSTNIGMVGNLNWLLRNASGSTFQILCADDFLHQHFLKDVLPVKNDNNVVFTNATLICNGHPTEYKNFYKNGKVSTLEYIWRMHGAPLSSLVFTNNDHTKQFDPSLPFNCDYEYLYRCHLTCGRELYYVAKPLVYVNLHDNNETKHYDIKQENIKALDIMLRQTVLPLHFLIFFAKRSWLKFL